MRHPAINNLLKCTSILQFIKLQIISSNSGRLDVSLERVQSEVISSDWYDQLTFGFTKKNFYCIFLSSDFFNVVLFMCNLISARSYINQLNFRAVFGGTLLDSLQSSPIGSTCIPRGLQQQVRLVLKQEYRSDKRAAENKTFNLTMLLYAQQRRICYVEYSVVVCIGVTKSGYFVQVFLLSVNITRFLIVRDSEGYGTCDSFKERTTNCVWKHLSNALL